MRSAPLTGLAVRNALFAKAQRVFGTRLAEVIVTHDADHLVGLDAIAAQSSDAELDGLRHAVQIADYLEQRDTSDLIQAWFTGCNPLLDDRPPALVIRDDPQAVRDAAQAHLATG